MKPKRIQRKRTKGWKMPDGAIYVGRGSKWGNPFKVMEIYVQPNSEEIHLDAKQAVNLYDQLINIYGKPITKKEIIDELKGKDLACWCKDGDPCHADVLLKIANEL